MIGLVDIGGTKCLAGVTGDDGLPGTPLLRATPRDGDPGAFLAEMLDKVRGSAPLAGVAVSTPGPFDRVRRRLLNPPGLSPAWHGLDLVATLGKRFGCPVYAENDANCAALAEARFGAGRGFRTVVYYTVSTGIGAGVVRDGELVISRHDTEAGHQVLWPEHLGGPSCHCGGHGCLEALASGNAIRRRFGRPAEELDDPGVWADVGRWLGLAVVNSVALLDCDVVVFGGGVINAWPRFEGTLRQTVGASLFLQPPPEIRVGELGVDRNLWGALTLVPGAGLARPAGFGAPDRLVQ
ncbi:MAG TPA: ROK family protein [Candidatus Binatia bacterium]|nr:ROK family protein [Candidatus Binatia bacterium]